jgi:translation initiation factor RLI1
MVDFSKCHPEKCDQGICVAVALCKHKLLEQEAPYEPPMHINTSLCKGCGDCARACPYKAIVVM